MFMSTSGKIKKENIGFYSHIYKHTYTHEHPLEMETFTSKALKLILGFSSEKGTEIDFGTFLNPIFYL